jgi:hypothetical protein
MKVLGFVCLAILLGISSATAPQMKINYYGGNKCTNYEGSVLVTWASKPQGSKRERVVPNCFNYNYGNSFNIADCYESNCVCQFYQTENCDDFNPTTVIFNKATSNQVCTDDSNNYNSFACYYY